MRHPMFRWRRFRHGAHQVKSPSLRGIERRARRPRARAPGSARGARAPRAAARWRPASAPSGARPGRCARRSGRRRSRAARPAARASAAQRSSASRNRSFAGEVLAAVRHVDRGDGHAATSAIAMRVLEVEAGVDEGRALGGDVAPHVQRRRRSRRSRRARGTSSPRGSQSEAGTLAGGALISCRQTTSGRSRASHSPTWASRARMPLTFQVPIFTAPHIARRSGFPHGPCPRSRRSSLAYEPARIRGIDLGTGQDRGERRRAA